MKPSTTSGARVDIKSFIDVRVTQKSVAIHCECGAMSFASWEDVGGHREQIVLSDIEWGCHHHRELDLLQLIYSWLDTHYPLFDEEPYDL